MENEQLFATIDAEKEEIFRRGRALFACPELGFQERKTEAFICTLLDKWRVPYQRDVSVTGVIASLGSGGYHLAVVADMDALPRRNSVGCIHACGHSIQVANALTALHALLPAARSGTLPGRVSFFFTPAEELTDPENRERLIEAGTIQGRSGKQDLIARGYFDDVDGVLSCHANGETGRRFDVDSVLTGFLLKRAVFHGKGAHSGAAPYLGRNALHGAVLAETALAFLKDQFPPEAGVRIHPVIKNVSGGINMIPDEAVLETYIRAMTQETLLDASGRFDECVVDCGKALGLDTEVITKPGYLPLRQNCILNQAVVKNMERFVSPADITHHPLSGASGDIGDLGTLLPSVQFGFSGIQGVFHTDDFAVRDEEFCYLTAAKVLTGTIADVLETPTFQEKNTDFFEKKEKYLKKWLQI